MNIEPSNRIKRLPTYVFSRVTNLKIEARKKGIDVIDMGMGNPDQPPAPHIIQSLIKAALSPKNHRYSASKGINNLRREIANWYKKRYDVNLDMETEIAVVIGSKEGLIHLAFGMINDGDVVVVPNPTYPIHLYCIAMSGGDLINVKLEPGVDFLENAQKQIRETYPRPKLMILSFPHNPTTQIVDIDFFKRVVDFAHKEDLIIIHDLAYADICFDGYRAPSFLQVNGAKDVGVEFYSMSKSFNMAGWRVGFAVGNSEIIKILTRTKSYMDYGIFQPIQIAAIAALQGSYEYVEQTSKMYQTRRDVLVNGLKNIGWPVSTPKATMYVWAPIPEAFKDMNSVDFSLMLLEKAGIAVSPGIGFGEYGEGFVRFALVENENRIKQAVRGMSKIFRHSS
ncbi:MAG: aminotransferase class I/II-fold pyridoxal phosphate-dependent enzyme [Candidatus Firestonebacteria bacterium]|nr:aminotransferase class I/II-fold pyridoxal phosphate-dependent enzyme [Candidatus Firestonebacteria bacterium]